MGIDFSALKHCPTSFTDGLEFFEDVKEWADQYERQYMVPNKWNHQLAEETTAILITNVPKLLKPIVKNFVITLMDERLRKTMMYEKAPAIYPKIVNFVFGVRKILMKYAFPLRPYVLR